MKKIALALAVTLLLVASGCAESDPGTDATPDEAVESPSPEPEGTFQLQGRILEAIGSSQGAAAEAAPTPEASPTESPDDEADESDESDEADESDERGVIEGSAPGSMSILVTSYSSENTSCVLEEGDTVTVAFTHATDFSPAELTESARFPRNLRETTVDVEGAVVDEESCLLAAESVGPQDEAEPSPAADGTDEDDEDAEDESPSPND